MENSSAAAKSLFHLGRQEAGRWLPGSLSLSALLKANQAQWESELQLIYMHGNRIINASVLLPQHEAWSEDKYICWTVWLLLIPWGKKKRGEAELMKEKNTLTMKIRELLGGLTQENFCPCLLIFLQTYFQGHSLETLKGRIQMFSSARWRDALKLAPSVSILHKFSLINNSRFGKMIRRLRRQCFWIGRFLGFESKML